VDSQLKKNPLRRGALAAVTTAGLLLGSLISAAPAQAAPGLGDLTVTITDPTGATLRGAIYALPEGTTGFGGSGLELFYGANTAEVPAGRYGVVAMTPWGGMLCAGVSPCDTDIIFGTGEVSVTGVVEVPDEGAANLALSAPAPAAVTGTSRVGDDLTIDFSEPMDRLVTTFGGGLGGLNIQWLRDGKVISGAAGASYRIDVRDVGHTIAPRLSWSFLVASELFSGAYVPNDNRTLAGRKIAKVRTTTKATTFRKVIPAGRAKSAWVDVVGRGGDVTGKVTVQVGKWKRTKRLWNGDTRVLLPKLKRGRYAVKVSYLGTDVFAPSQDRFVVRVR